MSALVEVPTSAKGMQRVMLVALTLIPLLLVTVSALPALIILPLIPSGTQRSDQLINLLIAWTKAILDGALR